MRHGDPNCRRSVSFRAALDSRAGDCGATYCRWRKELEAAEACILAPLSTDGAIAEGLREVAIASLAQRINQPDCLGRKNRMVDQKERKRKRALIVFQLVIYGYLLLMFSIQLYMSFARGWWEL